MQAVLPAVFKPLTSLYSSLLFPFLCQDTWHKRPIGHHPCSQNQAEMPDTAIEKPINAPFGKPPHTHLAFPTTNPWHRVPREQVLYIFQLYNGAVDSLN